MHRSVVLLLSFLVISCMSFMSHCSMLGETIGNIIPDVTGINQVSVVSGFLRCPFPSPIFRRNEPTLPEGVNVVLTCDRGRTIIGEAVTDTQGFFKITVNTLFSTLFHPDQCDRCLVALRSNFGGCVILPGHRGALLAPLDCSNDVEQLDGDEQGHGNAVQYKTKPFHFDPSYNN